MNLQKYIPFVFLFIGLVSCEKVIDLEVNDTEPKLVIEANYNAVQQEVHVKLTKTVNVFAASNFPTVGGAQIEIIDQNGNVNTLLDQGNGEYILQNYAPQYGTNYTMNVTVEGETYSTSDYLPPIVPLDSLTQVYQEESLFGDAGYIVFTNFTDPQAENYYRANRIVNGDSLSELGEQFIFDDGFSNGNNQAVPFFSTRHEVGDTIVVQFISYSENTFDYYSQLFDIAGESGQSAAPANPDPSWAEDVLGHFAAYGYDQDTIVITE